MRRGASPAYGPVWAALNATYLDVPWPREMLCNRLVALADGVHYAAEFLHALRVLLQALLVQLRQLVYASERAFIAIRSLWRSRQRAG